MTRARDVLNDKLLYTINPHYLMNVIKGGDREAESSSLSCSFHFCSSFIGSSRPVSVSIKYDNSICPMLRMQTRSGLE